MAASDIRRLVESMVASQLRHQRNRIVRPGKVTAIDDVSTPKTVTVNGRAMPYLDGYTPALQDRVIYTTGTDPVVLGKIATPTV